MNVCVGNGSANASPSRCSSNTHSSLCGAFSSARMELESGAVSRSFANAALQYFLHETRSELWYPRRASIHGTDVVSAINPSRSRTSDRNALSIVSSSSFGKTSLTTFAARTLPMTSANFACAFCRAVAALFGNGGSTASSPSFNATSSSRRSFASCAATV